MGDSRSYLKLKAGEVQDGIVFVIVECKQLLKRFLLQAERQNLVDAYIDVVYSCKYHIIFCPKYRRKVLVSAIASRLKELLAQIAVEIKVEILEMEIMPDHVHLLVEVDPQFGIHRAVKRFKGATSRYLRLEFPELKSRLPTLWTNSYFVSTVGGAPLETVKMYIQNQKETLLSGLEPKKH